MPTAARALLAVLGITAAAVAFAVLLSTFISLAPFHGPGHVAVELSFAAVVPLWAYAVRTVVRHALRAHAEEPSLR